MREGIDQNAQEGNEEWG